MWPILCEAGWHQTPQMTQTYHPACLSLLRQCQAALISDLPRINFTIQIPLLVSPTPTNPTRPSAYWLLIGWPGERLTLIGPARRRLVSLLSWVSGRPSDSPDLLVLVQLNTNYHQRSARRIRWIKSINQTQWPVAIACSVIQTILADFSARILIDLGKRKCFAVKVFCSSQLIRWLRQVSRLQSSHRGNRIRKNDLNGKIRLFLASYVYASILQDMCVITFII